MQTVPTIVALIVATTGIVIETRKTKRREAEDEWYVIRTYLVKSMGEKRLTVHEWREAARMARYADTRYKKFVGKIRTEPLETLALEFSRMIQIEIGEREKEKRENPPALA